MVMKTLAVDPEVSASILSPRIHPGFPCKTASTCQQILARLRMHHNCALLYCIGHLQMLS